MNRSLALALLFAAILFVSCGKEHADLPTSFVYTPLPAPSNVEAEAGAERCTLSWSFPVEAMADVREFRVYEYFALYDQLQLIGTTSDTSFVDSLLVGNLYYCFRVSAVDLDGFEGWRSDTCCAFVTTGP